MTRKLKVGDEAAEAAMRVAIAWGWLKAEGVFEAVRMNYQGHCHVVREVAVPLAAR